MARALPPIPPLPPVNWESRANLRFEPPVEQVVVELGKIKGAPGDDAIRGYWKGWGMDAMARLKAMLDDPHWKQYDRWIQHVIDLCPLAEAHKADEAQMNQLLHAMAGSKEDKDTAREFNRLISQYAAYNPDAACAFLLSHKDDPSLDIREVIVDPLARFDKPQAREATQKIVDDLIAHDWPQSHPHVINALIGIGTRESCERAIQLAGTVSPDLAKQTRKRCEWILGRLRAQEPMSKILKQEDNR